MVLFAQDSTKLVVEKDSTFYPGKPLLLSLVVPGLGQVYNEEPLWKPGVFIATEIVSITSIMYANKKADEIRMDYQKFADENWNVKDWWNEELQATTDRLENVRVEIKGYGWTCNEKTKEDGDYYVSVDDSYDI